MSTAQDVQCSDGFRLSCERPGVGDEEAAGDVDEPPDEHLHFQRLPTSSRQTLLPLSSSTKISILQKNVKLSLLTQALLTTPDLTPWSDTDTLPLLTSDGGLLSPARTTTPSPPLPTNNVPELAIPTLNNIAGQNIEINKNAASFHRDAKDTEKSVAKPTGKSVEEGLGRRRCITFACGREAALANTPQSKPATLQTDVQQSTNPPRRPCMLRFACPTKSPSEARKVEQLRQPAEPLKSFRPPPPGADSPIHHTAHREHRDSGSTIKGSPKESTSENVPPRKPVIFNHKDLELSEATRFHEFAGSFNKDDEWIHEQTAYRQKITVNDTLWKENAIRKLAEEAEEEALQEDAEISGESLDDLINIEDDDDVNLDSDEDASDGGNETDDEGGFADSDDDSDHGSQYQFWTPGLTTAATSVDHIEHIRPMKQRFPSESSIESMINSQDVKEKGLSYDAGTRRTQKSRRSQKPPKMRPGTPDLPDSTDFVCGTLDEDRPLEAAYMSCLEERRRSKHKVIPQDIDPSFPTSDPEAEEDDDDEDDDGLQPSDDPTWVMGRPDNSDEEEQTTKSKRKTSKKMGKSPVPSPKRLRSPAPPRRNMISRSPPPRRLFGQSPGHLRSPPAVRQKLKSPPSTRRTSCISPQHKSQGMPMPYLAQRPHLTRTTSLPRTPNPFWHQHRQASQYGSDTPSDRLLPPKPDVHTRGPIEIIKGLECRRQRRKEKLWRQHCRYAGQEKERKCQPGKGAERMKELGLEMANKMREYGQKTVLVLSV